MMFNESLFDKLQDYAQDGFKGELSADEQEYYNALLAQLGVYRKYGRIAAIQFLMRPPFKCLRRVATRMFDEAINLFYAEDNVTRQAWRNLMFEEMRNAALSILKTEGITPDDMETYRRLMESAYKFKQLDEPDPEEPDNNQAARKEIKVYQLDGKRLGLPNINRQEVASLIDSLNVNEQQKERLKTDAGVNPIDIDEVLNNTINISEDE
jgi:hypothetical protein